MKYIVLVFLFIQFSFAESYPKECKGMEGQFSDRTSQFTDRNLNGITIFTGSSSILGWKNIHEYFQTLTQDSNGKKNYINRGFGGSQICHLLIHTEKIFKGADQNQNPLRFVVYSGENDLSNHKNPEIVLKHYKLLIEKVRAMNVLAPIYIITPKPSPSRIHLIEEIKKTTELMESLQMYQDVYVINTYHEFFDEAGQIRSDYFLSDNLHVKPIVYTIWANYLEALW